MNSLGIYFHVPFCLQRCPYCNFYSTADLGLRCEFVRAAVQAVHLAPDPGRRVETVYFGGGTPSLLGAEIVTLLDAVAEHWSLAPDAEVTLECNPGTLQPGALKLWRTSGINRLSMGLQAGNNRDLATLGRIHTLEQGLQAVDDACNAGFDNISVDLMLATPDQTPEDALSAADLVAGLPVQHISVYLLTVEDGTPFAAPEISARCPDPDQAADIYLAVAGRLTEYGFAHYEISNFARPGFESQHNSRYWTLDDYLGIGPGAASFHGGRRFHFTPDLGAFLEDPDPWSSVIDDGPGGDWEEYLMLSLRMASGLNLGLAAEQYGQDPDALLKMAEPMVNRGLVEADSRHIRLTAQGFLVSNSVITAFL